MTTTRILEMTTGIIANFVAHNRIAPDELPQLVKSISDALNAAEANPTAVEPDSAYEKPTAAQVKRSVSETGLVSFLDGKTYQSLTRHLRTNGLTPHQYRARYGLRDDYPMVSPAYSAKRSLLAIATGLGASRKKTEGDGTPPKAKRMKKSTAIESPA